MRFRFALALLETVAILGIAVACGGGGGFNQGGANNQAETAVNLQQWQLIGTWERSSSLGGNCLCLVDDGLGISGTFVDKSTFDGDTIETVYDIKDFQIDGDKAVFFVDQFKSSTSVLKNLGVAGGPRQDFYLTLAKDGQSVNLYKQFSGTSNYDVLGSLRKKL